VEPILQALGTPRRREILRFLWQGERSAGEIRSLMPDVTFGAVSQHLRRLEHAGIVSRRRQGRFQFYKARKQAVGPLRKWLESMWSDALARLRVQAEMEEARRGPRPRKRRGNRNPQITQISQIRATKR